MTVWGDTFNRANSTTTMGSTDTGTPLTWVPNAGTWGINTNAAYCVANTGDNQNTTVVNTGAADGTVSVTFPVVGTVGVCFRSTDNNNYWAVLSSGGAIHLYKRVAGTYTEVGGTGSAPALSNGNTVSVALAGASIVVKVNGTTRITASDAFNQTATRHGLYCFTSATTERFDNWSFDDGVVVATSTRFPTLTLEWLPGQGPGVADGTWADITTYLMSGNTFTGRQYELERFSAGTATFNVADTTRLFDPEWTSGTWFGQLVPMRQIRLKATWNSITYDIWRGYVQSWGHSVPSSDNIFYSTITCSDATALFERMGLPDSWYGLAMRADNPTHWWRLDEAVGFTAADAGFGATLRSGSYEGGLVLDSVTCVPFHGGRKGPAFMDGQYVNIPAASSEAAGDFSLEAWFVHSAPIPGDPEYIVTIGLVNGQETSLNLSVTNDINGACASSGNVGTASGLFNDGIPHQVVMTRSGGTLTLYVDGVSVSTDVTAGTTALPVTSFVVGRSPIDNMAKGIGYFNGSIGDVSFWSGTVLSATQILNHYNAGENAHSGDDTGRHITRVLDYKGFPSSLRNITTGVSTVGAYELNANNVAEFIQQMADTEGFQTYCDPAGKLLHRARTAAFHDTRSAVSQATFGDLHGSATLNYVAEGFSLVRDPELIRNPVIAQRSGGSSFTATDTTYTAKYGDRAWQAPTTFDASDNVSVDRANVYLGRYKELGTRVENVKILPQRSPTLLFPQALGRLIGDKITVKRKPLNTGNETSLDQLIEAIKHTFDPHVWTTEWRGSPPDTANYGLFDDGTIFNDGTVYGF